MYDLYCMYDEVKVAEEYKYLTCVVNEHLQSARMAEERAKAGTRAVGDWLRRCRAAVGEVKGSTFMKLMEMLVESVLLYGAGMGVWRAAEASGKCAHESSKNLFRSGKTASTGLPTV